MPVYKTRTTAETYGHAVGILLLDYKGAFVPGDVGNATSYDYPVLYKTVPGATMEPIFRGDPDLEAAVVEAARELEAQGVKGISSDCGFFVNYQEVVAKAVKVPVFLSSLLQLPMLSSFLGRRRSIGVITADSRSLGNRVLELTGIEASRDVVIAGMQDEPHFVESILGQGDMLDSDLIEAETVRVARRMVADNPAMGAILIECSMLPPYSKAVQDATGLPVYDFLTMIDFFQSAAHRTAYDGRY